MEIDPVSSPVRAKATTSCPAVIPAAGLGSRMPRLTHYMSKELLPLGDTPVLGHVLAELAQGGVREVVIVSRAEKTDIEAYVDEANRRRRLDLDIRLVMQGESPGNGGAILSAMSVVGDRPFLVVWGDEVFLGPSRVTQLLTGYEQLGAPCIAVRTVLDEDVAKCGIVHGTQTGPGRVRIDGIVEKPRPDQTTSRSASVGGFLIDPAVVDELHQAKPGADGEIFLSTALDAYARRRPLYGVEIDAQWFETGSYEGYAHAFVAFARARGLLDGTTDIQQHQ